MPCVPGILFGAVFILARAGEERRRTAFIVGAALLTASSGIWATAYSSIYRHEDSRVTASTWLLRRIKENQLILREPRDNPLPLPITPSPKFQIRDLQLYEQSPQAAATLLARDLADGDWLIIASRRNRGTLPRLYKRFPLACFYYRELFQGELGYELVRTFANEPAFFGLTVPTRYAEETFQVFDHPTTTVFRNTGKKSATDIRDRLLSKFELKSCSPDQIN